MSEDVSDCEKRRAEIIASIDGERTAAQTADAQAHLAVCPACASFYAASVATLNAARDAYPSLPSIDLTDNLREEIRERDPLLEEIRAMRAEVYALRGEMAELRQQLTGLRGLIARTPSRPIARPLFPYTASEDRQR